MAKPIKKILCPVDFSDGSRVAVDYAIRFAERVGASVELFYSWHVTYHVRPDLSVWSESHGHRSVLDIVKAEAESDMRDFLNGVDDAAKKRLATTIRQGEAAPSILERIGEGDVDLVVMGTHGRGGLARVALGSVAERVVRHSSCPVLTVRMPR